MGTRRARHAPPQLVILGPRRLCEESRATVPGPTVGEPTKTASIGSRPNRLGTSGRLPCITRPKNGVAAKVAASSMLAKASAREPGLTATGATEASTAGYGTAYTSTLKGCSCRLVRGLFPY